MTIRVFIDQGHNLGEINAGANGNGVVEAEVTYRVGKYLAKYLNTDPAFTARVWIRFWGMMPQAAYRKG